MTSSLSLWSKLSLSSNTSSMSDAKWTFAPDVIKFLPDVHEILFWKEWERHEVAVTLTFDHKNSKPKWQVEVSGAKRHLSAKSNCYLHTMSILKFKQIHDQFLILTMCFSCLNLISHGTQTWVCGLSVLCFIRPPSTPIIPLQHALQ